VLLADHVPSPCTATMVCAPARAACGHHPRAGHIGSAKLRLGGVGAIPAFIPGFVVPSIFLFSVIFEVVCPCASCRTSFRLASEVFVLTRVASFNVDVWHSREDWPSRARGVLDQGIAAVSPPPPARRLVWGLRRCLSSAGRGVPLRVVPRPVGHRA